ncbi:hypothetical protein RHMOL_Rhmol04G0159000 [Rhododendron molle]|uniref:Uncharacterized protein n=2 Tax=Rhododendron molle TaxID=49168 RepID=A0ACC0P0V0_RHOML|nr:hypothetical protein RHMOL_Rhmol04G0159000 [Rhododendron molle]KAI8559263.1 hypothetical protein RHMOL_Rhmol04G0159000 [Rhododendron molle]
MAVHTTMPPIEKSQRESKSSERIKERKRAVVVAICGCLYLPLRGFLRFLCSCRRWIWDLFVKFEFTLRANSVSDLRFAVYGLVFGIAT